MRDVPDLDPSIVLKDKLVCVALPPAALAPPALDVLRARDLLYLEKGGPAQAHRLESHVRLGYPSQQSIVENNCNAVLLHGLSALALMKTKVLVRFETILVPAGIPYALARPAIFRHARRGRLRVRGQTELASGRYWVIETLVKSLDNRRQYGPAGTPPLDFLQRLAGLDYAILRWVDSIEAGTHEGDIDIVVSAADAPKVAELFRDRVATWPLDIYSEDGSGGFFFAQAPYLKPSMARQLLQSAVTRASGLRAPSDQFRFLSFAYHLLLHIKSRRVPPGTNILGPGTFRSPKYYEELLRLARVAGAEEPRTFDDLEQALRRADCWPSFDLLGFYAEKNPFLKHRYFGRTQYRPGLMTVFVRDFGGGLSPVPAIRDHLREKFEIWAEGSVTEANRQRIENGVRGGNWSDPTAPNGTAKPVYWFVCIDPKPAPPSARTRRKRARFDNENTNFKHTIRLAVGARGVKEQRIVHSSDNSTEALEHIGFLDITGMEALAARFRVD